MLKRNWKTLLITSLLNLLPIAVSLILWDKLPGTLATHWNLQGTADGWSSKAFAIFFIPLFMLGMHWFCILVTARTLKDRPENDKTFRAMLWVIPIITITTSSIFYVTALEYELSWMGLFPASMGLIFLIMGNYLPKCTRNKVMGIKVIWALTDDENWNATHRFAGRLWFWGGAICIACGLLPMEWGMAVMGIVLAVMAFGSVLYSYLYYRKQLKKGRAPVTVNSRNTRITLGLTLATLVFLYVVLFTGNIEMIYNDTSFTIDASSWSDLTLRYDRIDSIEFSEEPISGSRTNGYGSPKLLMGSFHNDEVGYYTRYTYTKCDSNVQLWVDGKLLVISGADDAETREIYGELTARIG